MAAKAVNARKRFDRNNRSRGHGPLLQKLAHPHGGLRIHRPCRSGPWPQKRLMPWKRIDRNHRFRGHGPLLQKLAHSRTG